MKKRFQPGETRHWKHIVSPDDTAAFADGPVHPVYATFALARDAEFACRQFVLEAREEHEEGIGTYVSVEHLSGALPGARIDFTATVEEMNGNTLVCKWEAYDRERIIAKGKQIQKILSRDRLQSIFESLSRGSDLHGVG
jgi:predicted thioesterase